MNILITICGRGGSKSIPGKNIRQLNGKPLIAYSIESAKRFASKHEGEIELSTDSIKIKEIAENNGLQTSYERPFELATDTVGKIDVLKDLFNYKEEKQNKRYDIILDLDVTSPLRTITDLDKALEKLLADEEAINIFSVNPANRNPYFNMVEEKEDGYVKLVKSGHKIKTRQNAPKVYDMNASFYFYKRIFFEKDYKTSVTNKSLVYVMPHMCFDLDEPHDFTIMEIMLRNNLLDFEL